MLFRAASARRARAWNSMRRSAPSSARRRRRPAAAAWSPPSDSSAVVWAPEAPSTSNRRSTNCSRRSGVREATHSLRVRLTKRLASVTRSTSTKSGPNICQEKGLCWNRPD